MEALGAARSLMCGDVVMSREASNDRSSEDRRPISSQTIFRWQAIPRRSKPVSPVDSDTTAVGRQDSIWELSAKATNFRIRKLLNSRHIGLGYAQSRTGKKVRLGLKESTEWAKFCLSQFCSVYRVDSSGFCVQDFHRWIKENAKLNSLVARLCIGGLIDRMMTLLRNVEDFLNSENAK